MVDEMNVKLIFCFANTIEDLLRFVILFRYLERYTLRFKDNIYMYMSNIDDNAMTISGRFAEDYDKKKKKACDEPMPRKCILVANLFRSYANHVDTVT